MRYSVHITNLCNLRCTYCYEDDKNDSDRNTFVISFEEIDRRFTEIYAAKDCHEIELLGGEIFLFLDKVEYVFNKYGKDFSFILTTNGTIRNKAIDDLISKYKPTLGVSLDDPLTISQQRIGIDFETVLANAKYWNTLTRVIIDAVITPQSIRRIKETFDFYILQQGFSVIHFGVVEEWMNDYYWQRYLSEVKRFIDTTDVSVLKNVTISPWQHFSPSKKEIIYEDGIEKLEIFNSKKMEISTYLLKKYECHEYFCKKIGCTPDVFIPKDRQIVGENHDETKGRIRKIFIEEDPAHTALGVHVATDRIYACFKEFTKTFAVQVDYGRYTERSLLNPEYDLLVLPNNYEGHRLFIENIRKLDTRISISVVYRDPTDLFDKDYLGFFKRNISYGWAANRDYILTGFERNLFPTWAKRLHPLQYALDSNLFKNTVDFFDRQDNVFVYMGRLDDNKFPIVPVSEILYATGFKLDIYGATVYESSDLKLKKKFKALCASGVFRLCGFAQEPYKILNQYRYALLLSGSDLYSKFIFEAMACGCIPFVQTRHVGPGNLSWFNEVSADLYSQLPTYHDRSAPKFGVLARIKILCSTMFFLKRSVLKQSQLSKAISECIANYFTYAKVAQTCLLPVLEERLYSLAGELNNKRKVFFVYHIAAMGDHWQRIFQEQVQKMQDSGLLDAVDRLYISFLGSERDYEYILRFPLLQRDNVEMRYSSDNFQKYEYPAFDIIQELSLLGPANIGYVHSKGVTKGSKKQEYNNVEAWREYLDYFSILKYEQCLKYLNEGFDICGVEYNRLVSKNRDIHSPHFAGNFWWARSEYLVQLPVLIHDYADRFKPEFWVAQRETAKVKNMFSFGKSLYQFCISPKDYQY